MLYPDYETISKIRGRLLDTILIWGAIIGAPAILFTFLRHLYIGALPILTSHSIAYLIIVAALVFRRTISFRLKSLFIVTCSLIVAVTSIFKWGLIGMGVPFFMFCSILVISLGCLYYSMLRSVAILKNQTHELNQANMYFNDDVSGGEDAKTAFYESEEQFRTILEDLPISVFVHDLGGKNLFVNNEACRTSGFSKEELLNMPLEEAGLESLDMHEAKKMWVQLVETGESKIYETVIRRKTGLKHNLEIHLKSIILQGRPVILTIVSDITERKKTETSLKESEERFKTVLENLPGCVSVHDTEGNHLMVNEETCIVTGYTREELFNMTVMDAAGPDFNYDIAKKLWNEMKPGSSSTFDISTKRKDGSLYDSEVHLTSINLEGKKVILSLIFDITERKKIEESLARRSELERLASEISSGFVGMSHEEIDRYIDESLPTIGKKIEVDHAYLFLLYDDGELVDYINEWCRDDTVSQIGKLENIPVDKDLPWFAEQLRKEDVVHIPDTEKLPSEALMEKTHFKNLGIKSLIILLIKQGEKPVGFLGFDTTYEKKEWSKDEIVILRIIGETFISALQRRRIEKEQEKLKVQLTSALDLAHLGPWEFDIQNDKFISSDHFYRIYHTTAKKMGGYTMTSEEYTRQFVHPDDFLLVEENIKKLFEPDALPFHRFEHRMLYEGGKMGYVMVQMSLIKNSKGIPVKVYGVNQDISEWKAAQQKLRESEEKLARSRKMESLGLLAGGVAHDLNNVLSGIVSYPELLLYDLPEGSKMRGPIETIRDSGNKAAAIVQDLLTIARGAVTSKEPLNINNIISEYLSSPEFIKLKSYHPSTNINTNLQPDLFNVSGSSIHIKKVIMNLVSNAAEAIESKGDVNISTRNISLDKPLSRYEEVKTGEYIVLSVSDSGLGIAPNNLERIFEPFFTKKVMGVSGTGLGLAVVWNIVQDHSGYIDVKSDENGTQFDLYFPITRDEILDKSATVILEEIKGKGEKILVIDDIERQREISCRMLDILGYQYSSVSSGEAAIAYLKENQADLILLDMIMDPGISGRKTYEQIIKIHPKQKAVIVSGFSETEDVVAIQRLGAGQYIKKPFTLAELGYAIRDELLRENR